MQSTINLLDRAEQVKPLAAWTKEMKLSGNVLYTARLRGRLSPILAGAIAEKLGEDVQHWITVAVLETEKESGALDHLKKTADRWLNKVNS